ncbi:MAG: aldehyde dehydrogenase family protein, partial [Actinomycetales bacterium]
MARDLSRIAQSALAACGAALPQGTSLQSRSPITGAVVAELAAAGTEQVQLAIERGHEAFLDWRTVPAPTRGAVVRHLGQLLQQHQGDLANLIMVEVGKIRSEALGEVQEMIDICEFALGLARQLDGRTMPSERPGHRLMETWHPRGVVAVISAFNFPAAVWSWNTAVALVCGDAVIWKPSELTPLTSLACSALLDQAVARAGAPAAVHQVVLADADSAGPLLDDPRVALVSATGSERMGAQVAPRVAARFGATLLELGGNNACIVTPSADLDLATRGIVFAAAGTAGQRCTTMRRVIAHESIAAGLIDRIRTAFAHLRVGDPFEDGVLVGPLINEAAFARMQRAI